MLKINVPGIIATLLIGLLLYICNLHQWDISYFYVVPAVIFYVGATIALTYIPSHEIPPVSRFLMTLGTHLTFSLLTAGLYLNQSGFWVNTAIFVASIIIGMAVPFMIFKDVNLE